MITKQISREGGKLKLIKVFVDHQWYKITGEPFIVLSSVIGESAEYRQCASLYDHLVFYNARNQDSGLPTFIVNCDGYWCATENFWTAFSDMAGEICKQKPNWLLSALQSNARTKK